MVSPSPQCVDILILILAISAYDTTSWLLRDAKNTANLNIDNREENHDEECAAFRTRKYIRISKSLKMYFNTLNDVSSGFYTAWFCMIVPWFSFRPLQTLQLENFPYTFIHNWTLMIIYGIIWGCCAEAKRKVHLFRSIVEDDVYEHPSINGDYNNKMAALRQIEHAVNCCGVNAGRFFQFSYECLGNVIGLVIAYALLFVQFHSSSLAAKK